MALALKPRVVNDEVAIVRIMHKHPMWHFLAEHAVAGNEHDRERTG